MSDMAIYRQLPTGDPAVVVQIHRVFDKA